MSSQNSILGLNQKHFMEIRLMSWYIIHIYLLFSCIVLYIFLFCLHQKYMLDHASINVNIIHKNSHAQLPLFYISIRLWWWEIYKLIWLYPNLCITSWYRDICWDVAFCDGGKNISHISMTSTCRKAWDVFTVYPMKNEHGLIFVVFVVVSHWPFLPILFRITSLALGQP